MNVIKRNSRNRLPKATKSLMHLPGRKDPVTLVATEFPPGTAPMTLRNVAETGSDLGDHDLTHGDRKHGVQLNRKEPNS